jgi:cytoplasmic iron level regulating protein YaaA (DUF328/UPF0246 family)
MAQLDVTELEKFLHINHKLGIENFKRYQSFHSDDVPVCPAIFSYTGNVFKRIFPSDFTNEDFSFAQKHLLITSFLYGLLRPLDGIKLYRMEGNVQLYEPENCSLFDYWKDKLTPFIINEANKSGNILLNLASEEMKKLFHWKQIAQYIRIITPEFKVIRNGKPQTIVIYTKMARGEMTRYILKNKITDPENLKAFTWEGFSYNENLSDTDHWIFTHDL